MSDMPIIKRVRLVLSWKNIIDTTIANGDFRLLNTAKVAVLVVTAPLFHKKKHIPEAIVPK